MGVTTVVDPDSNIVPLTFVVGKPVMAPPSVPISPFYTEAPVLATLPELVNIMKLDKLLK